MKRISFYQPNMAVDSRSLIEPTLLHRGVYPYRNDITSAIIQVICEVVLETAIATWFNAQIVSVNPNDRVSEYPIELDEYFFSVVSGGDEERFSIPSNTTFRKIYS